MKKNRLPKLDPSAWPDLVAAARARAVSCEVPQTALARWNAAIRAKDGDNTINIYDPIGFDWYTGEGVTAKKVAARLDEIGGEQVGVNINSPGGDVFEGVAIYNLLRNHKRKVTVRVMGLAASAASIIAMAGDDIQIARAGFMMIHNVWVMAMGNGNDLRAAAEMLEPFDDALAEVYAARTELDKAGIAAMMDKETWFNGAQAVDEGFADGFLPADQVEEKPEEPATQAALRRVEAALIKAGMPRSERRAALRQLTGTPSAAGPATPRAGDAEVTALVDLCRSIHTKT